jgi:hypothetical protein
MKKLISRRRMSRETLINLGFKEKWAGGNPTEPCWELAPFWFWKRPLVTEFWEVIENEFVADGRREVRELLKKAYHG